LKQKKKENRSYRRLLFFFFFFRFGAIGFSAPTKKKKEGDVVARRLL
jgi:hypothetical protein